MPERPRLIESLLMPDNSAIPAQELEDAQVELVASVKSSIKIPLAVKLSQFYTSLPRFS